MPPSRKTMKAAAILTFFIIMLSTIGGAQTSPVVSFSPPPKDTFKITNLALIIGTDTYAASDEWPTLTNPTFDAQSLRDKLQFDYGYTTMLLKNPSKDSILEQLAEIKRKINATNKSKFVNLVIFVAGYGGWDNGKAFIVPTDAKRKVDDRMRKTCIALADFRTLVENINAPHSLVLIDACFGGSFDKRITGTDTITKVEKVYDQWSYLQLLNEKMPLISAKYLTSGGKEYVEDSRPGHHSPLTSLIIKELDVCYENAQPLSFARLVNAVKPIKPQPRAGDFANSEPNSEFLLIPNSITKGKGKKPKYDKPKQKVNDVDAPMASTGPDEKPTAINPEELEPKMEHLKGGTFPMGSFKSEFRDEGPLHMVKLTGFYMSKFEVTQKLWMDVMGYNPSAHQECDDCPVEMVSWDEVQKFIFKLNRRTKRNYRLPTEAEWEYAANCGEHDMAYEYSGSDRLEWVGWAKKNSDGTTHSVGQKSANTLGIFDLSGNVAEWCQDMYSSYPEDTVLNPVAHIGGNRVIRGGDFTSPDIKCRNAYRSDRSQRTKESTLGFRLVLPDDNDPEMAAERGN